jgi:hypothetical protein
MVHFLLHINHIENIMYILLSAQGANHEMVKRDTHFVC